MKNRSKTKEMPQMRVRVQPFANPKERQEFLMNLAISAEFEMRHRGLLEFYGKDLIAYKQKNTSDKNCNEFLRVMSKFMTDWLEDKCPSSWKKCQPSFWEEFIFTFYPHSMKISPNKKEVETFLSQLRKFVRWLDRRAGTSWYPVIEEYASEAGPELKICEHLLNDILLSDFPRIHHDDWNLEQDYEKIKQKFNKFTDRLDSIFEVTSMIEDSIVLTEFNSNRTYYIKGLPCKLIKPGIIMSGAIGKRSGEIVWNWYQTEGIYPQRGKNYITLLS
jgi:hypothetical protein